MPRPGSDQQLIADAQGIAERATPLADRFAGHGLPATVVTDLPAQIAALEQAILRQKEGRETHVGAKAAAMAALASGSTAMDVLERIYLNAFGDDPNAVAMWHNARRVGPSRAKEAGVVPVTPAGPHAPPATRAA